jgi:hypothetical protein
MPRDDNGHMEGEGPKTPAPVETVVTYPVEVPVAEPAAATSRAIDLARAAEMLPDVLPGPRLRPVRENPKAWLYRAAKLRFKFGDEEQLTQDEFDQRIAAVSTVLVR